MKFIAIIFAILYTAVIFAGNLIENPSFENIDDKGLPVKWKANKLKDTVNVEHKLDMTDAKDGQYAAAITNTSPENGANKFMAWIQDISPSKLEPYIPEQEMLLTFDYCTDAPATAIRAYVEGRAMGKGFSAMGPTGTRYVGWGSYSLRFRLPKEKPSMMYVVLQLLNTGTVRFDNVRLSTAPPSAETPKAVVAAQPQEPPKLHVRYLNLPPRNTYHQPTVPRKLQVRTYMGKEKFSELFIRLKNETGQELGSWRLQSRGNLMEETIELPTLKAGLYYLESSATSLGHRLTDSETFRIMADPGTKGVRFREDHIMMFNGEPYFPLAVCPPFVTDEALAAYQAAGFNTITPQINASGNKELADFLYPHAAKYDLNVIEWINFADGASQPAEELEQRVIDAMKNTAPYRNFIGWMNDEDAWRGTKVQNVKKVYDIFFKHAPNYILWCNQAPRGSIGLLTEYGRYCDVTGADVYPVPASVKHSEMSNKTIACVGDYVDDFIETVGDRKPVWMILQAWSWGGKEGTPDKPFPTASELRFMFYNAITHGATGIAWFDNFTMDPSNPIFKDLAAINLEFREIEKFITRGTPQNFASTEDSGVRLMERLYQDERLMIAVNEFDQPRRIILSNDSEWYLNGRKLTAVGGKLTLDMKALDVAILTSKPVQFKVPASFPKLADAPPVPLSEAVKKGCLKNGIVWRGNWVWDAALMDNKGFSKTVCMQKFTVKGQVTEAWLACTADNIFKLYINGKEIGGGTDLRIATAYDIAPYLQPGENTITVNIANLSSYGGVVFEGEIKDAGGTTVILSGEDTLFNQQKPYIFGPPPIKPWGNILVAPIRK